MKKKNKFILCIFIILLFLAMMPFEFTKSPEPYMFGWLPFPLFYWWILMFVNLIFVLFVVKDFAKNEKDGEENNEQ
ncbi:hypothetical protein [uncultured Anaerococcus sp.]|uniref:hypothetical protein n=1 Tax=uncultured Anaerococcus sp. TaxID=293428 RepID=UPI002639EA2D|nr:hypothetical protein [uncultured Anaerococcus sp.]